MDIFNEFDVVFLVFCNNGYILIVLFSLEWCDILSYFGDMFKF